VSSEDEKLPGSVYSRSFGSEAARYHRFRPSYPTAAIDHVLADLDVSTIVDLGAGTGKLTASLIGRAPTVIAVEPDDDMLSVLRTELPEVESRSGSAEHTGLPDSSVDAVFAGQAFHWFPRPDTDIELARILRPGGRVGLLWNFPDREVGWVTELYDATGDASPPWTHADADLDPGLFEPAENVLLDSQHILDGPAGLLNLVHTWSWVITRAPGEQAEIDERIHQLIEKYPQLQGEQIRLPQTTKVIRQQRRG
jgi:SAM-dependent methyltransferase